MKKLMTITGVLLGLFCSAKYAAAQTTSIQVEVSGIKDQKGTVYIGFYKAGTAFPAAGKQSFRTSAKPDGKDKLTINIPDVEPGDYALAIYQDINNNGKLDKNFIGIPKEPYAFSNNFHPKMSAPKFEDCKITVSASSREFAVSLIH